MLARTIQTPHPRNARAFLAAAFLTLALGAAFSGALLEAVKRWSEQEEYSHGFLIPIVAAWLLWMRRDALAAGVGQPSWSGLVLVAFAVALHVVAGLSALFLLSQAGMMIALLGISLCVGGFPLLRVTFVPIAILAFAIPLPYFLDSEISLHLQLLSSEFAATLLRALQIPVFLSGNVIDLGTYKLQVVEACSGLRYLYPLLGLGFLIACLFPAKLWQRGLVFISAVPITIAMNSLRIVQVAVSVDRWGPSQAEGSLHLFEGWIIFLACAGLLFAEASLLARLWPQKAARRQPQPPEVTLSGSGAAKLYPCALACLVLLCMAGCSAYLVANRQEAIPGRQPFAMFPTHLGEWTGRPSSLEPQVVHFLRLTDYIVSDYSRADGRTVNLYIAYYASQRSGVSPHSPQVCIPGNGWQIAELDRRNAASSASQANPFNRAVIERGPERQIVHYWFAQRGRQIANEYMSKWYLLRDAVLLNRTDGALVRLTTALYPDEEEKDADTRLQAFARELAPALSEFLPRPPRQSDTSASTVAQRS